MIGDISLLQNSPGDQGLVSSIEISQLDQKQYSKERLQDWEAIKEILSLTTSSRSDTLTDMDRRVIISVEIGGEKLVKTPL